MNNAKNLLKNPRIIIFILAVLVAIFAIHPGYTSEGATSHLHYGLDLEGGSWLQLKLEGTLAQIDADPGKIVIALVEPAIGSPINITNNNLLGGGSDNKYITFTTSAPINASQIERLGLGGSVSVDKPSRDSTQVTITSTSKEFLIRTYLAKSLDTEVVQTSNKNVLGYEIKKSISEKDLEALMEKVGGFIVKNQDG
ncbi:MAG: preprotein translocase subunit SecD, partial [Candidatus Micrarchaeaceae archaeon]